MNNQQLCFLIPGHWNWHYCLLRYPSWGDPIWKVWGMRTVRERKWNETLYTFSKGQNDLWGQRITSKWDDRIIKPEKGEKNYNQVRRYNDNIALREREHTNQVNKNVDRYIYLYTTWRKTFKTFGIPQTSENNSHKAFGPLLHFCKNKKFPFMGRVVMVVHG